MANILYGVNGEGAGLVLAIEISRIYLGVHYPSDVVAGYIAAAMWVGTMLVIDHVGTRAVKHVIHRRTRS
jgi:membrane-associated phospholipid phosphatase